MTVYYDELMIITYFDNYLLFFFIFVNLNKKRENYYCVLRPENCLLESFLTYRFSPFRFSSTYISVIGLGAVRKKKGKINKLGIYKILFLICFQLYRCNMEKIFWFT